MNYLALPREFSGFHKNCIIYKVPPRIRQTDPEAYTPRVISIGPFHSPYPYGSSGDNVLHQKQQLKLQYLKEFLQRTKLSLDDFVFESQDELSENKIRSCYAGLISFNSNDFLKIIIIDACFIIEHFLRVFGFENWFQNNDPILRKPWLLSDIKRDLVLLENQLPFFVLEDIYKLAGLNLGYPLLTITTRYFQSMDPNMQNLTLARVVCSPLHFTALVRAVLIPMAFGYMVEEMGDVSERVYSASQLSEAGLVFEVREGEYLVDMSFDDDKGVLKIPCLHVHHTTESCMRNIIAYEECDVSDLNFHYISQYFIIVDFLINTEKDVSMFVDKKIIVNRMGDANEVATMVNNLRKNVSLPPFCVEYI